MKSSQDNLGSQWARLGCVTGDAAARGAVDAERLVVWTAGELASRPEVLGAAAGWLAANAELLARHRLRRMIIKDLAGAQLAAMGLLLDLAGGVTAATTLDFLLSACRPLAVGRPLARAMRGEPLLVMLARDKASEISRRWGLWHPPTPLAHPQDRPWILQHNPILRERALLGGGLKASVLACLRHDFKAAGESDLALACGATRKAVHDALEHLQQGGWVKRTTAGRRHTYRLSGGR